jgi:hypothetical protein
LCERILRLVTDSESEAPFFGRKCEFEKFRFFGSADFVSTRVGERAEIVVPSLLWKRKKLPRAWLPDQLAPVMGLSKTL